MGYPFSGKLSLFCRYTGTLSDMQNIKYGMKKKNVDCEALEAGMREAFPQITWYLPEYQEQD